jgi:phospholipase/carboxylesterase
MLSRRVSVPDSGTLIRVCLGIVFSVGVSMCGPPRPEVTRLHARPGTPTMAIEPGEHPLGLGGTRALGSRVGRDGTLYVPKVSPGTPAPLLVLLHGGGGRADDFRYMFPLADEFGVVFLALDARDNTWDGIDSPYGPDVVFIDAALTHTFQRVAIDPRKVAIGGLSDGASYALSLGAANGDLFTDLIAVAPGFFAPPAPPVGRPRIYVGHGTRDNVYSVGRSRNRTVPELRSAGYEVTYREFDGPHWIPAPTARDLLEWLTR